MDVIRAQRMEFRLEPPVFTQWWRSLSVYNHLEFWGSTAGGDFLYPVQVKLFLFLFLIIKYVIWRDKILLCWCLIQNTRVSKGKKVSFKATPSGQCPPHSRLASTESCGCGYVHTWVSGWRMSSPHAPNHIGHMGKD